MFLAYDWSYCKFHIDFIFLQYPTQGSSQSGSVLNPAEVLIAIHGIDPERDGIPLKKVCSFLFTLSKDKNLTNVSLLNNWRLHLQVIDACNACFEQRQTFTQQIIAKVLNQLVCIIPMNLPGSILRQFFLFWNDTKWLDPCRLSRYLFRYCSCARYCKPLVLFQHWWDYDSCSHWLVIFDKWENADLRVILNMTKVVLTILKSLTNML